jgi:DnaK suppressor protein
LLRFKEATMNAQTKSKLRAKLESLQARIGADARSVTQQALDPSGSQGGSELSNAPYHLADEGSEEFLHDMTAALAENEVYLLAEVQDAISRLEGHGFGQCERCGKPIAVERLEAMPYARFCVNCAASTQAGLDVNLNSGRPRGPADTLAPEGAMQEGWRPADASGVSAVNQKNHVANDPHAAGEPGGGSALGGLAGSNAGDGSPEISDLQDAAGSGRFEAGAERDATDCVPQSGRSGGAVGGTPARKRSS